LVQGVGATPSLNFRSDLKLQVFSIDKIAPGAHLAAGGAGGKAGLRLFAPHSRDH